jgi:hypothetical protein
VRRGILPPPNLVRGTIAANNNIQMAIAINVEQGPTRFKI